MSAYERPDYSGLCVLMFVSFLIGTCGGVAGSWLIHHGVHRATPKETPPAPAADPAR